jgi:putative FmdB family regulatory protein
MPIYEYKCQKNGHTFEVRQRFSDDPVETCEVCGAPVQRVFHPVAVHFKGKGFYNTDYGTRKRARELKESAEGSSKSSDSGSSGDSGSQESKSSDSKSSDSKSSDSKKPSDSKGSKSESTKAAA